MTWMWLFASLVVSAGLTWLARRYALRRQLLDAPGERRAHTVPTPRGGGIGIVVVLVLAALLSMGQVVDRIELGAMLAGLVLVAGVGLIDDHRSLSPFLRLGVQVVAAGLLAAGTWHATHEPALAFGAFVLAMALTNIWNFMDGIDGIAASQTLLVALPIAVLEPGAWSVWAWALVAAILGFLPFNFPKARIFLGDVGSGALGFALAALLIHRLAGAPSTHAWLWALPPSAFLIDAGLTLARRVLRRERWWRPHAQHAYQAWAREAGSHVPVTCAYAGWTVASILLMAWLGSGDRDIVQVSAVIVAWYIAGGWIWLLLQGKGVTRVKESTE
jgi:UDP-N-acetylmuramyl pentapeptide phosphotransferase/UDP-N-acetylglucosamine-1-phosphate transferase